MTLPLEIIDVVFQNLQTKHLLVMATVSLAWSHLSLGHLYRTVYIPSTRHRKQFLVALQSLPLTSREAIRAIHLNSWLSQSEINDLDPDIATLGFLCPRLEEFTFVTLNDTNAPASHFAIWIKSAPAFHVDLPLFPFMRCIGTYLHEKALDRYRIVFDQLTSLALTDQQLLSHINPRHQQLSSMLAVFPALETLDLISESRTSSLDALHFTWLQHHCPRLRHMSLRDLCLASSQLTTAAPILLSVELLALKNVKVESSEWFPLLASMCPALKTLFVDINTGDLALPWIGAAVPQSRPSLEQHGFNTMTQEISDWITGCSSLATLHIRRLGAPSTITGVLENMMDMAQLGTWDCRLKRFALAGEPMHRTESADQLFGSRGSAILGSLDTLHLNLANLYDQHTSSTLALNNNDFSCAGKPIFPMCSRAPTALTNLTSLYLQQCYTATTSMFELLQLCPNLRSLGLRGLFLQTGVCHRHSPDPEAFVKSNLAELVVDRCTVLHAELFISFLQHGLPWLTSLTLANVDFWNLESDPIVNLDNRKLKRLQLAAIMKDGYACSSIYVIQSQLSGQTTRYDPPDVIDGKSSAPFQVVCGDAEQLLFNKTRSSLPF
ncbi:hypothetical protein DM01DRAFT_114614 [Hesseltinella vesiculosa]|uniref:F-box domain-containing protein n=1 Tax=Hesseltinella vesiculosa TaxID=101127 RepID=A0A1X2GFN3_9FUNG|nr:hypothetical protein DM01DRAFT_114614 [Hesseltinella vesiculosa]